MTAQLREHLPEPWKDKVHQSREYPVRKGSHARDVCVFANSEKIHEASWKMNPREMRRLLTMEVVCFSTAEALDTSLDDICSHVEAAIDRDLTLSATCQDVRLQGTELGFDVEGERIVGSATMTFEIEYQTTTQEVDGELVWFNRYGVQYDLAGQQDDDQASDLVEIRPDDSGPSEDE